MVQEEQLSGHIVGPQFIAQWWPGVFFYAESSHRLIFVLAKQR